MSVKETIHIPFGLICAPGFTRPSALWSLPSAFWPLHGMNPKAEKISACERLSSETSCVLKFKQKFNLTTKVLHLMSRSGNFYKNHTRKHDCLSTVELICNEVSLWQLGWFQQTAFAIQRFGQDVSMWYVTLSHGYCYKNNSTMTTPLYSHKCKYGSSLTQVQV